jgi:hypothetical protein
MPDVPCEALIVAALAVALWGWSRALAGRLGPLGWAAGVLGAGVLGGLATLAKLTGLIAPLTIAAWGILALALPGVPWRRKGAAAGGAALAGVAAFATFVAGNPTLTAHPTGAMPPAVAPLVGLGPLGRLRAILVHRTAVSAAQLRAPAFARYALETPWLRAQVVAVQGFGRFGPFGPRGKSDSTVRFDWDQDWGAILWLPWVALGLVAAIARGQTQLRAGEPPAAWAIVAQSMVALVVVSAFIPLAWDRYFLSIQPGLALLGAIGAVEVFDRVRGAFVGKPRPESTL